MYIVTDPGFPKQDDGAPTYYLAKFPENSMKIKKKWEEKRGARHLYPVPYPPIEYHPVRYTINSYTIKWTIKWIRSESFTVYDNRIWY